MAQSRFDRIAALFEAARALPSDEWAQYLEAACPDRQDLRDEVLEMLIEKERAFSWFDSLENRLHVGAAEEVTRGLSRDGERIGPYRIVREVGRGGMETGAAPKRCIADPWPFAARRCRSAIPIRRTRYWVWARCSP